MVLPRKSKSITKLINPHRWRLNKNKSKQQKDKPLHRTWKSRLDDLRRYEEEHGHVDVPRDYERNPELGHWVHTIRKKYRRHLKGEKILTAKQIADLDSFGFVWRVEDDLSMSWEKRLEELRLFKMEHGHVNVPGNYKGIPGLAKWVAKQRRQHKLMKEGKNSNMTEERIALLETLGFEWSPSSSSPASSKKPQQQQRRGRRQLRTTDNRLKHHNRLWAQWEAYGTKESARSWRQHMDDLKRYKKEHGNCVVPEDYEADPELGSWVAAQRRHYRMMKKGKQSNLSKRRMRELESVGFELRSKTGEQAKSN